MDQVDQAGLKQLHKVQRQNKSKGKTGPKVKLEKKLVNCLTLSLGFPLVWPELSSLGYLVFGFKSFLVLTYSTPKL